MPNNPSGSEILTIKAVSEYAIPQGHRTHGLSLGGSQEDSWVQGWGAWRFSKAEIDQWIRRQSEDGTSDDEAAKTGVKK